MSAVGAFGGHWVNLVATRSNQVHIGAISGYWFYLGVSRTILGPIRAVLGLLGVLWPHEAGANCWFSGLCFCRYLVGIGSIWWLPGVIRYILGPYQAIGAI